MKIVLRIMAFSAILSGIVTLITQNENPTLTGITYLLIGIIFLNAKVAKKKDGDPK